MPCWLPRRAAERIEYSRIADRGGRRGRGSSRRGGRRGRSSDDQGGCPGTTVLLTTQHLEEAEKLADRIAILHEGTIIVSGTLAELRTLLPSAKVEYVERQPTLEEIFLSIIGSDKTAESDKRKQQ